MYAKFHSIGAYVPSKVLSNADAKADFIKALQAMMDELD